jgi:hypothetical protein
MVGEGVAEAAVVSRQPLAQRREGLRRLINLSSGTMVMMAKPDNEKVEIK